jgi:CheY-like chemotaxis protein
LAGLLKAEPDMEIIGEASDGKSAVNMVGKMRPDVVLMDINLPGISGIDATRIIHRELPGEGYSAGFLKDLRFRLILGWEARYCTRSDSVTTTLSSTRVGISLLRSTITF